DLVLGDGDVHALGGQHLETGVGLRQILLLLGPDSAGEDGPAGVDVEFVSGEFVAGPHAGDLVAVVEVADDGDVVGRGRTVSDGRAHQRHHEAGVVDLRVVVLEGADRGVIGQAGEVRGQRLL